MRVGIVVALRGELACFGAGERMVEPAPGVCALLAGIGPEHAARAADELLAQGARALASFGVAGGLDPRLAAGAVVLANEVVDLAGVRYLADAAWRARVKALHPRVIEGAIAESDVVLATRAAKAEGARATSAVAVDMESGAIARAASAACVPFLALRAISDAADQAVPRASLVAVDGEGNLRLGALAGALMRRPTELAGLFAMHGAWRRAVASLEALVATLGAGLASEEGPYG